MLLPSCTNKIADAENAVAIEAMDKNARRSKCVLSIMSPAMVCTSRAVKPMMLSAMPTDPSFHPSATKYIPYCSMRSMRSCVCEKDYGVDVDDGDAHDGAPPTTRSLT